MAILIVANTRQSKGLRHTTFLWRLNLAACKSKIAVQCSQHMTACSLYFSKRSVHILHVPFAFPCAQQHQARGYIHIYLAMQIITATACFKQCQDRACLWKDEHLWIGNMNFLPQMLGNHNHHCWRFLGRLEACVSHRVLRLLRYWHTNLHQSKK